MKIEEGVKLDFSDVLIRPKRSTLSSRSEVILEREFTFPNATIKWTGVPITVSNMDTTGTFEMYKALLPNKMLTCCHKFYTDKDYRNLKEEMGDNFNPDYFAVTIGIRDEDYKNLINIMKVFAPTFVCIDVANGYSHKFLEFCKQIRKLLPSTILIGGNVVTREMVEELIINGGLDIVKVGIGSGATCITRLQTGVGYPQLSAVMECADAAHGVDGFIMSDGGVQHVGDFSKAFGAGADFVMAGSMFAGYDESGGDVVDIDGKKYKEFYGMSSSHAMKKYYGEVAKYRTSEGKLVRVDYKGPVISKVLDILGGIRSTMTYIGSRRLKHIPKCTSFLRVNNQVNRLFS
jgi:GMP reductase